MSIEEGQAPGVSPSPCPSVVAGIHQDEKTARDIYQAASARGHAGACNNLGKMMLEARGGGGNAEAAVSWFQAGAGMGSVSAMYNLARCCHQGLGMPEDWSQARALYLVVSAGV